MTFSLYCRPKASIEDHGSQISPIFFGSRRFPSTLPRTSRDLRLSLIRRWLKKSHCRNGGSGGGGENALQGTELVVGFMGMPSAGKSSLINSIVGKRILQTGVCRTTKGVHLIGVVNRFNFDEPRFHKQSVVSDDGVAFSILDLPGVDRVADVEDKGKGEKSFGEMTIAWSTSSDVVCWYAAHRIARRFAALGGSLRLQGLGRVRTCFLTTHEKDEFDKVRDHLRRTSTDWDALPGLYRPVQVRRGRQLS
jgi:hypothetical protein